MATGRLRTIRSSPLRKRQIRSFDGSSRQLRQGGKHGPSSVRRRGGFRQSSDMARAGPGRRYEARNRQGVQDPYSSVNQSFRTDIGYETWLPEETWQEMTVQERNAFERLPAAKKNALIRRAWEKTSLENAGMEETGSIDIQDLKSHPVVAGMPSKDGYYDASSYRRKETVRTLVYDRDLDQTRRRKQIQRNTQRRWQEGMSAPFTVGTARHSASRNYGLPSSEIDADQPGREESGGSSSGKAVMNGRSGQGRHRAFTRQIRRSLQQLSRKERAKEEQIREAKEQYQLEEEQKENVRAALTGGVKGMKKVVAILSDSAAKIRNSIIQGKAVKIIFAMPIVVFIILLLCLFMSLVTVTTQEEPTFSVAGSEIVAYAKEWIGITKYIYGAGRMSETDWQDYADCSSFVHGVFSHFGYEIGGDTVSMESSGTLITSNSLEGALLGDIVLFYSGGIGPGQSTHVGIYAGNGEMVHCSGGRMNVSPETAGRGVCMGSVAGDGRAWEIRRIVPEGGGGVGTGGHRVDPSNYSRSDIELIWAIVAQEDNGSYEGALAVISCAMNRTESPNWSYLGSTAMQQLTAPGQFCYSMDHYWEARLNGNVPEYVKQAVSDCLEKGIRNHSFTSFRSTKGKTTGDDAVQIGGNWFFGN